MPEHHGVRECCLFRIREYDVGAGRQGEPGLLGRMEDGGFILLSTEQGQVSSVLMGIREALPNAGNGMRVMETTQSHQREMY